MDLDAQRFDRLVQSLVTTGTRRGLLGALTALPLVGGLFGLLDPDDGEAKGRRKRRKKRHKHGKGNGRRRRGEKKRTCKAKSRAKTCNGTCGPVRNTCKKTVDCGSCDCAPPCDECFTCQGEPGVPGTCLPLDAGTPCGDAATCQDGTLFPQDSCDGSGTCAQASPVSCAPYTQCAGDACASSCATDDDCVADSYCNGEQRCVGDQDNGQPCAHGGQCLSGFCVDEVCCASASCPTCQVCNVAGKRGACAADPDRVGDSCGSDGKTCQANGECVCIPVDPCTGGVCGVTVTNNCGQSITCRPCPVISTFLASPGTIDRGAAPPETATLTWTTSEATACTLDDGTGPWAVACGGGTEIVGPAATATYTLTASNATGADVTAQATVTVQYCHGITSPGHTCPTGNTQFCLSEPISATNAGHAVAACEACYGAGQCITHSACGDVARRTPPTADPFFAYFSVIAGKIVTPPSCNDTGGRWAP